MWKCSLLSHELKLSFKAIKFNLNFTTSAFEAEKASELRGFLIALSWFIQERQLEKESASTTTRPKFEPDPKWLYNYPVQFVGSAKCWKIGGYDESNPNALESGMMRCTPSWHGKGPRNDHYWVQKDASIDKEYKDNETPKHPLDGKRVAKIQAILRVFDLENLDVKGRPISYPTFLVDIYPLKEKDREPHPIHGMIEVLRPRVPTGWRPTGL